MKYKCKDLLVKEMWAILRKIKDSSKKFKLSNRTRNSHLIFRAILYRNKLEIKVRLIFGYVKFEMTIRNPKGDFEQVVVCRAQRRNVAIFSLWIHH